MTLAGHGRRNRTTEPWRFPPNERASSDVTVSHLSPEELEEVRRKYPAPDTTDQRDPFWFERATQNTLKRFEEHRKSQKKST